MPVTPAPSPTPPLRTGTMTSYDDIYALCVASSCTGWSASTLLAAIRTNGWITLLGKTKTEVYAVLNVGVPVLGGKEGSKESKEKESKAGDKESKDKESKEKEGKGKDGGKGGKDGEKDNKTPAPKNVNKTINSAAKAATKAEENKTTPWTTKSSAVAAKTDEKPSTKSEGKAATSIKADEKPDDSSTSFSYNPSETNVHTFCQTHRIHPIILKNALEYTTWHAEPFEKTAFEAHPRPKPKTPLMATVVIKIEAEAQAEEDDDESVAGGWEKGGGVTEDDGGVPLPAQPKKQGPKVKPLSGGGVPLPPPGYQPQIPAYPQPPTFTPPQPDYGVRVDPSRHVFIRSARKKTPKPNSLEALRAAGQLTPEQETQLRVKEADGFLGWLGSTWGPGGGGGRKGRW